MSRRFVVLTEGHSNPHTAKTACNFIRYRRSEVVAVLDKTQAGRKAVELLDTGDDVPIVASLDEAPGANGLLIGIAPPGGKIPASWRVIILQAIERGMNILSGLHEFISDDPEFQAAAQKAGVKIEDVRKNREKTIARRVGLRPDCLRVHTVGHDCSIGKMVVSLEVTRALQARGKSAKFIATGQTGIMIEGDGTPIDCVVADFVSGAAEQLVLQHQHHDILLVEGQGSLVHPSYASVTLGLLHGCAPHALILCYEAGRTRVAGLEHVPLPSLAEIKRLNEIMAGIYMPTEVIGIAINGRKLTAEEGKREREKIREEFQLPVCDVFRDGPDELVQAVLDFHARSDWQSWGADTFKP